ncbi:MAG TPA: cobaltochelatase subunit CobN [Pyrinomonadaceae bacterium]|jgi:magnesium chelatase subunit H|nr:cobaltochelatase subunit CobN [Pyrinomonadaceae bacterium]
MNITFLYVGSSLLAPLRQAERDIRLEYKIELRVAAYNFGAPLNDDEWREVERDLNEADVIFVIHVMDGENAARLLPALERYQARHHAVVVINCMPDLMRRTRMGSLDFGRLFGAAKSKSEEGPKKESGRKQSADAVVAGRSRRLLSTVGSWMGEQARARRSKKHGSHTPYLKLVDRLPGLLRFVPNAGKLRDIKHYLMLFCYFLQPTPANIRSMVLYALKIYVPDERLARSSIRVPPPETVPAVALYHPDAPALFESFAAYRKWYERHAVKNGLPVLEPGETIGLLLMRPQIVSRTRRHYDGLIRAIEAEGLAVLPATSTLMDNREACEKFFIEIDKRKGDGKWGSGDGEEQEDKGSAFNGPVNNGPIKSRVSQIVSLTGFSFVGGPAMNDSEAAARFLRGLKRPFRSAVSLDMQTIESWRESGTGLNPVQAGMQIAIPEIDGATEPFVYGGMPEGGCEPVALEERCGRFARRLKRWHRLQVGARQELKVALLIFCFPPNKGNVGTAADLDVFPSAWEILRRLKAEGYAVDVPADADALRAMLMGGNSERYGATANVAYRMNVDEYRRLCPYVEEIEEEWGAAPGRLNSFGGELLVQGINLGGVFLGVQPTFGYEGDPMRLLMARSGAPHHGFMALYTYLEKVLRADVLIHLGTHGALEFMPGKQVGLSDECWPDRLTGELPNIYIYSVNNPSEGSIAKRRSYAELISYLTPPIENAGLYKDLASLKELLAAYRQTTDEREREQLFASIEETARALNF